MQSFKATVRKKYRLVRGHLTHVTHVSMEMLKPRSQSFAFSTYSPYDRNLGKKYRMPNTSTYLILSKDAKSFNSYVTITGVRSESCTTELFCECGCHQTLYIERSKQSDRYFNVGGMSCPACDKPYSEFLSRGYMAKSYSEKSIALSVTGIQLDCVSLFDDFLEKEKLSLKFMGHMTYYNPNRVKLYSSDHVAKLIYSHKNGRMYFYDKKSVYDVTYQLDSYVTSIIDNFGLYSAFRELTPVDDPHVFEITRMMMDNEEVPTEPPSALYYFSDFFRRVYDVLDKPRWAPEFDELNPLRSLKSTLMSIISPLTQSMFPHYDQNALSSLLGKQLRHFKKESDALDMMLHQPSGHYRKLVRSAIDMNEVAILNRVAFSMAGLFKEPSHLNTILSHASEVYREVVDKKLYFDYSPGTFERVSSHIASQRLHYMRRAEQFDFSSSLPYAGMSLSIYHTLRHKHSGAVNFPITLSLKNNKPVFERDDDCRHLHGFRKRFGISDRRLVDIIKHELDCSIKHNPSHPLDFITTMRDMNRLIDLIRCSCSDYTPKIGLDMYEAEKRLVNLSKRVGVHDYPFDYSKARLALQDEIDGHRFRLPKTSGELMNIGNRLNHCVGGYHSVVQSGGTTIVVVEKEGYYILAIEVTSRKVTQVKGMDNNIGYHIPDQLKKTVKKWIQNNKLTLSTNDLSHSHGKPVPYVPSDYTPIENISFDQSSLDAIYRARIEMRPRPAKRISAEEARSILKREIQILKDSLVGHEEELSRVSEPEPFDGNVRNLTEYDLPF